MSMVYDLPSTQTVGRVPARLVVTGALAVLGCALIEDDCERANGLVDDVGGAAVPTDSDVVLLATGTLDVPRTAAGCALTVVVVLTMDGAADGAVVEVRRLLLALPVTAAYVRD